MSVTEVFWSLVGSFFGGAGCGVCFAWVAGDPGRERVKTILVGIGSALAGWLFGIILPINEHKAIGVLAFGLIAAVYGCHIYWAVFKKKSKFVEEMDANVSA